MIFVTMKSKIALVLLLTYLFTSTHISELCKLPALVSHYNEHKHEQPAMSFWSFLCIHYAHGEVNDRDFDKDMKLPFKSHTNCFSCSITYLEPAPVYDFFNKIYFNAYTQPNFKYASSYIPSYFSSIWQPPQLV